MKKEDLINWAKQNGYSSDRYGHLVKEENNPPESPKKYRLRVSQSAARIEIRGTGGWIRLRSNYLKNLFLKEGKLQGLLAAGCQVKDQAAALDAQAVEDAKREALLAKAKMPGGSLWMKERVWILSHRTEGTRRLPIYMKDGNKIECQLNHTATEWLALKLERALAAA